MEKKQLIRKGGIRATLTGLGTALGLGGGEKALWKIYSSGLGCDLNGAAELNGFLNWVSCGHGVAAGKMILKTIRIGGWVIVLIQVGLTGYEIYKVYKEKRKQNA